MFISKSSFYFRELNENNLGNNFFKVPDTVKKISRKDYQELHKHFKKRMKYINILL